MDGLPTGRAAFTLTSVSAGAIRLDGGAGRFVEIQGSFLTDGATVTGGTTTGVRLFDGGQLAMDLTNLTANPVSLVTGLLTRNPAGVEHQLFGGADEVDGSPFADTLSGHTGDDTLIGADGADYIRGFEDADYILGGRGDDDVNGNTGADVVHGDEGADTVRGGQDADYVFGDAGDDPHVNGNLGDDEVYGGDGNDSVYGGQGNDFVFGDAGNDQLSGDLGNDTLTGGAGADRFMMRGDGGADVIMDFRPDEGDRIVIAGGYSASAFLGPAVIELAGGAKVTLAGVFWFDPSWVVAG